MTSTKKSKAKVKDGLKKINLSASFYSFLYELFSNLANYFWKKYYRSLYGRSN